MSSNSNEETSVNQTPAKRQSHFSKILGRSIIKAFLGDFFENKNNTASILAIILVYTLCWVIIVKEKYENMTYLVNIVFVIIGYYFGVIQTKQGKEIDE